MVLKKTLEAAERQRLAERAEETERNLRVIRALGQMAQSPQDASSPNPDLGKWYKANDLKIDLIDTMLDMQERANTADVQTVFSDSTRDFTKTILDSLIEIADIEAAPPI